MLELLPWFERLGALLILGLLLWFLFTRLLPKLIERFAYSLTENTEALRQITDESRTAHERLRNGMEALTKELRELRRDCRQREAARAAAAQDPPPASP